MFKVVLEQRRVKVSTYLDDTAVAYAACLESFLTDSVKVYRVLRNRWYNRIGEIPCKNNKANIMNTIFDDRVHLITGLHPTRWCNHLCISKLVKN